MLNISFLGGYISQDSSSQNYTESAYYNSNSDLNGNTYGEVSGANANSENWDQLEKPTYNYYAQNSSTESSLYKTKLCRHFIAKGYCNLGEKCNFAHGQDELRNSQGSEYQNNAWPNINYAYQPKATYSYQTNDQKYYKTVLCRNFQDNGVCQFGDNCKFAHGDAELRPLPASTYPTADYNSYSQAATFGTFNSESLPTTNMYYNYGSNYSGYQDPSLAGTYASNPAPTDAVDANQVYNYSYSMYPGYPSGYNYEAAGGEGAAAATTLQTYYSTQKAESYVNNNSG